MKQQKYRIWDKSDGCFITKNGHSLHCYSNWSIDVFSGKLVDYLGQIDGDHGDNFIQNFAPDYFIKDLKAVKECPYVVQEFTGLKDAHGKEIYEGDIMFADEILWEVLFDLGMFCVRPLDDPKGKVTPLYQYPDAEIIGNIFENPKPLK
jgi:YopX protein